MHWIVSLLPGRQVAARVAAIGRRDIQSIVVVDVAQTAGNRGMAIGQREAGRIVVEHSCGPRGDRMARRAGCGRSWEPGSNVIGHVPADCRGADERRLMAAITIRRTKRVVVIDVAGRARRRCR